MKILVCTIVAVMTLSFAGCGVKDWFDEKLNGKDEQQTESVVDSVENEDESEFENEPESVAVSSNTENNSVM